jgi:hypothetical protein
MRIPYSLLLSCAVTVTVSDPALGQATDSLKVTKEGRTYRVSGLVTDAGREPLPEVEVAAMDTGSLPGRRTKTDNGGRFDLGRFQQGTLSLRARRIGYEQTTVQVKVGGDGQPTSIEIVLLGVPAELENVNVTASPPPTKLRGFYERSSQKRTFGRFLDQHQIRQMNPRTASELFRSVPGVTLASNQSGGNAVRIRGCQPMVWLDDQRVPGAELDDLIVPSEIAAIEFYVSAAGIPAQYLDRGNRLCGLILVWTKAG